MATEGKFYCNMNALNSAERGRHKQLTDKLIATRKEMVEGETGYEFHYHPSVSVAELAEWVVAESKCCPSSIFILISKARVLCCACD